MQLVSTLVCGNRQPAVIQATDYSFIEVYEVDTLKGKNFRRNSIGNVPLCTRSWHMAAGATVECGYIQRRDTEENVGEQIEIPNMPSSTATPIAEDRSA